MTNDYDRRLQNCQREFDHATANDCTDRDCEIHNPWMQDDEAERLISCAWFIAGMYHGINLLLNRQALADENFKEELPPILRSPDNMEEVW